MVARIGVGSAVTVEVGVSVAGRVTAVGLGVREGVLVGTPMTAVAWSAFGEGVIVGIGAGVEVAAITATGSGVGGTRPVPPMI